MTLTDWNHGRLPGGGGVVRPPPVGLSPTEPCGSRSRRWGRSEVTTGKRPARGEDSGLPRGRRAGKRSSQASDVRWGCGGGTNSAGSAKAFKASEQENDLELCSKLFTSAPLGKEKVRCRPERGTLSSDQTCGRPRACAGELWGAPGARGKDDFGLTAQVAGASSAVRPAEEQVVTQGRVGDPLSLRTAK